MVECSEGVQVLSVLESGRYECSLSALTSAGAARDLPVAVVSVAGATRGGKSFLLDFFLRYLRAPEAARRSGAWLGADDAPLTGFSWRGGCERHTEGIMMWSEPIVVTVGPDENKEKVAVVLLDTQGSFDSSSTVRDSSTVFAVSTLLSSVQVYNLSQNIKEDDLQYLQLFTEYGKLALDKDEVKPFQELRFLVRDWSWAYQHPHGAEGGQQLLDKRLEIHESQAPELREVRAHIRGAFERVTAFLMPHPGLTAASNPHFTGCLKDISAEFKEALLDLVPSLFAPENLTVKRINGQKVILQDFLEYFKTYVEIFNSDTLPTPTTVMQATSAASLDMALSACREAYRAHMERSARGAACVSRAALPRHHTLALRAARHAFDARRTLAPPAVADARLDHLLQELDASLPERVAVNSGRILEAAARCKAAYETAMQTDLCLPPGELETRHYAAIDVAKAAFEDAFSAHDEAEHELREYDEIHEYHCEDDEEDNNEDWEAVKKDLQELLSLQRVRNGERVDAAAARAREEYCRHMQEGVNAAPCLHAQSLATLHRAAGAAAAGSLRQAWLDSAVPSEQKELLKTCMKEEYQEFVTMNDTNNNRAIDKSKDLYENIMMEICSGRGGRCLHPLDLSSEHERALVSVVEHFQEQRDPASREAPHDVYHENLIRCLFPIFLSFQERNDTLNKEAVKSAHEYYMSNIAPFRLGGEAVLELFGPPDIDVFARHPRVKEDALDHFLQKRRPGATYNVDIHLDDLKKQIENSYAWITVKVLFNLSAQSVSVVAMGSMIFRR